MNCLIVLICLIASILGTNPPFPIVPHAFIQNSLNCSFTTLPKPKYWAGASYGNTTFAPCSASIFSAGGLPPPYESRVCALTEFPEYLNTITADGRMGFVVENGGSGNNQISYVNTSLGAGNVTINFVVEVPFFGIHLYCAVDLGNLNIQDAVPDGTPCYYAGNPNYAYTFCEYASATCVWNQGCYMYDLIREIRYYTLMLYSSAVFPVAGNAFTMI